MNVVKTITHIRENTKASDIVECRGEFRRLKRRI